MLEKDPRTAPFAEIRADTICGENCRTLWCIQKVYIKPANGALGTGIYQLTKTDDGLTVKHTNDAKTFSSIDYSDAAAFLAEFQNSTIRLTFSFSKVLI